MNAGPVLAGSSVVLRPWREDDVAPLGALRNDVALQALLMAAARPNPPERVREWLAGKSAMANVVFLVVAGAADDRAIGYVQVVGIDHDNGHGELGICMAPAAQQRGCGAESLRLLEAHLATGLGLDKLILRVRADNALAIAFYRKHGWRDVGRYLDHYRTPTGRVDVLLMEKALAR